MEAIMPAMPTFAPSTPRVSTVPDGVVLASKWVSVVCLLGLIVLGLLWELWLAPTGNRSLAVKVLPLTLPLAGLLKHRLYTYRWLSLLVWVYCTEGLVRATSDHGVGRGLAVVEVVLCVVLFGACATQVWWRLRHREPAAAA